jgi:molecular chaperone GrpE
VAKNKPTETDPADVAEAVPPEAEPADATREAAADPLESLQAEVHEAKDRTLRIQAELENYRKRAVRELQEERRYAHLPLIRELLPVWDNMNRAIEAAEKTHDAAGLLEGVKMVARQLEEVLQRHDCRRIPALSEPFDPHLHEAILQQHSEQHPPGTVLRETQTGFLLHDRVVRPSQVIVSGESGPAGSSPLQEGEEEAEEKETE